MDVSTLTATVIVERRPLWKIGLRFFPLMVRHYKTMRRADNDRIVSLVMAWRLARIVLTVK